MLKFLTFLLLTYNFLVINTQRDENERPDFIVSAVSAFVFWPNATVPFYINPDHFDQEQTLAIVKAISTFAFKTCIKFAPVMSAPDNQHVLVFVNPDGARRCTIDTLGHSNFQPHIVHLGYDCLKSPQIDMMIMRSLGLPFEHNRMSRDIYINVLLENVEPGAVELFTKDAVLPPELRILPYDHNSVMHFGERDYSRNGHRTIIFKDRRIQQNRIGLSQIDLKKIDAIYNSVCRERDRQEKIDLCQTYPGAVRRKRDTRSRKSLRVNPDITPPPNIGDENVTPNDVIERIAELGINDDVQEIIDKIHKMSAKALQNAQTKYCNVTDINVAKNKSVDTKTSDINSILTALASYAQSIVDMSLQNLTVFCQSPESMPIERALCGWGQQGNKRPCPVSYRSTNIFAKYSTQHRPVIVQSTKPHFHYKHLRRTGNETDKDGTIAAYRDKRDATTASIKAERDNNTKTPTKETEAATATIKTEEYKERIARKKRELIVDTTTLPPSVGVYGLLDIANEFTPKATVNKIENTISTKPTEVRSDTTTGETPKNPKRRGGMLEKRFKIASSRHKPTDSDPSNESIDNKRQKMLDREREILSKKDKAREKERQDFEEQKKEMKDESFEDEMVKMKPQKGFKKKKKIDYADQDEIDDNYQKDLRPQTKGPTIEKDIPLNNEDDGNMDYKYYNTEPSEKRKKPTDKKMQFHDSYGKSSNPSKFKWNSRTLPNIIRMSKLNKEFYDERKWPGGLVPYLISPLPGYDIDDVRERILEVDKILRKRTCVRLKEITADEAKGFEDYLVLDNSPDYVTGRVGGKQNFGVLELFEGGQHRQHAAMVVMAMLGFYFEVARHDRDQHIRVHLRHVRPDKLHHFEKIREEATLNLPYDFDSATHPAWQFWRKIGKTGISTVATYKDGDPDGTLMKRIGQNEKLLSDIDIIKINTVYGLDCFEKKGRHHS